MNLQLRKMTQLEFDEYRGWALDYLAHELSIARDLSPEQGKEEALQCFETLAPQGRVESQKYIFVIESNSLENIGVLWFGVKEDAREPYVYVWDIFIYDRYRGKGYGEKAMRLLETEVSKLGLSRISLNVFGHNTTALGLYRKLGYSEISTHMHKCISSVDGMR